MKTIALNPRDPEEAERFSQRRFHWAGGGGLYVLEGSEGDVAIRNTPFGWEVWLIRRESEELLSAELTLTEAQSFAENIIEASGAALAWPDARWRLRPVSARTIEVLERLGLRIPETQGEASDLLTFFFVSRALSPATPRQQSFLRRHGINPTGLLRRQASRLIEQKLGELN